jgi:hypothetical protein
MLELFKRSVCNSFSQLPVKLAVTGGAERSEHRVRVAGIMQLRMCCMQEHGVDCAGPL